MFVDDIRVLYGTGDGGDPFTRDPSVNRQYAIMPRGQIAGWPVPDDPAPRAIPAWTAGFEKQQVIVALLDDGVERNHPDLLFWEPVKDEQRAGGNAGGDETEEPDDELFPGEPVATADRHGTACAGVLGAVANNGIGIAGVAPGARLLPLHRGVGDLDIVRAIDAAVGYGAHVLVIPWGWTDAAPEVINRAILDALDAGLIVVAAAGDGVHRPYSDAVDFPCSMGDTTSLICVGASGLAGEPKGPASTDGLYWWSSAEDRRGPDLLAPGSWLQATDRAGPLGYNDGSGEMLPEWTDEFGGTGASACYVGGVATLVAARDPLLAPGEVKRMLISTATIVPSHTPWREQLLLVDPVAAALAATDAARAREATGE
jgi:subtilisin family serine protease